METLVLTVIGDDRAGLVKALADTVTAGGGNWERSQLAELAGKFAGIVVVTVPAEGVDALKAAFEPLSEMLDITIHHGRDDHDGEHRTLRIDVLGNDTPGIVREISGVLVAHGLSVESMTTQTRNAPMAGGTLFDAEVIARIPDDADPGVVRTALEQLATEIQVDLGVDAD